jgi:uncharacterized protein (DUF885 family)
LQIVGAGLPAMLRGGAVTEWRKGIEQAKPLSERLAKSASKAADVIDDYRKRILADFPLANAKDIPIGAERWATLARLHEGVTESPDDVRAMGAKEIVRLDAELDELVLSKAATGAFSGPAMTPEERRKAFFEDLERDTLPSATVLDEYRAAEKRVEEWIHAHPIADVPWSKVQLAIVPTPPHMRGISFASLNVAGALDAISDARFQVTEPDPSMPAARQEALLRFHARGALDLISVHEAIPGHYLQYLFVREVPSTVRKVTWASTFGEGWAHYCEQMAMENGFTGVDAFRTKAFYLRMALQRAARVVVDVAENDGSMSLEQGAKFLQENALLAAEAAKIEARRAVVWPANMFTYTYGKLVILKLREAVRAKEGPAFDLRTFHDRLLAVGGMPVTVAGELAFGAELK